MAWAWQGLGPGEQLAPGLAFHRRPNLSLPRLGPGEKGEGVALAGAEAAKGRAALKAWGMNLVARFGTLASQLEGQGLGLE